MKQLRPLTLLIVGPLGTAAAITIVAALSLPLQQALAFGGGYGLFMLPVFALMAWAVAPKTFTGDLAAVKKRFFVLNHLVSVLGAMSLGYLVACVLSALSSFVLYCVAPLAALVLLIMAIGKVAMAHRLRRLEALVKSPGC